MVNLLSVVDNSIKKTHTKNIQFKKKHKKLMNRQNTFVFH